MATSAQTEAFKMISEWCKWLVTIETAAIGLIGSSLARSPHGLAPAVKALCILAILSFLGSIFVAGAILSAIPTSLQDIQDGEKVLDRRLYALNRPLCEMWVAGHVLFFLFLTGMTAFGLGAISLFW